MNNDVQARGAARMKSRYALGCAALLSLCCMPYRASAQSEPSGAAASTPDPERIVKAGESPKDAAPESSSAPQLAAAQRSHRERENVASAKSSRAESALIAVGSSTGGAERRPLEPKLSVESANRAAERDPQTQASLREPTHGERANRAAEGDPQTQASLRGPKLIEGADRGAEDAGAGRSGVGVVNINTAGAAELERLPRIGPTRAQAILGLRAKLKQFSRIEQLLQVKGIGRATFRMLRPLLALSGPTTLEHKHGR